MTFNTTEDTHRATQSEIRQIIEKIERVDDDKAELMEHRKEILAHAKTSGYDVKAIAKVIARRKMDREALAEQDAVIALYEEAAG